MRPDKISLVVPTFQERDNISPLLKSLAEVLTPWDHEIIVVDDSSPDGTGDVVRDVAAANPRVRLISREGARDQATALLRGFNETTGNIIGTINADLSHDAAIIPALIRDVEGGAEMAVGSRRVAGGGFIGWPWHRRLASAAATSLTRRTLRLAIHDPMSGYYILRRTVFERAQAFQLHCRGFKFMLNLLVVGRPDPITERPYVFTNRRFGSSKVSFRVVVQFPHTLWRLRRLAKSRIPLGAPGLGTRN